jgi:hypothetical protein
VIQRTQRSLLTFFNAALMGSTRSRRSLNFSFSSSTKPKSSGDSDFSCYGWLRKTGDKEHSPTPFAAFLSVSRHLSPAFL